VSFVTVGVALEFTITVEDLDLVLSDVVIGVTLGPRDNDIRGVSVSGGGTVVASETATSSWGSFASGGLNADGGLIWLFWGFSGNEFLGVRPFGRVSTADSVFSSDSVLPGLSVLERLVFP
jgi:hypothetical protein